VPPVEYTGWKRSIRAYIAVCLQIHCNPSSFFLKFQLFEAALYCKPVLWKQAWNCQNMVSFDGLWVHLNLFIY